MSRREPLIVAVVALLGSAAVGIADGSLGSAAQTAALLAAVGGSAVAAGRLLARRRGRIGSLRTLLLLAMALAGVQLLVAAAAFAGLMFVSSHDALLLSLVAVYCGIVGAAATRPVAEGVIEDIAAVRDSLHAVAAGRRELHLDAARGGELGELTRAARAMAAELGAQEEARRRLVSAVSHDLRTPITSLRLLTDGLREEVIPPEERDLAIDRMAVHLRALSRLIDDLFELSRLESGQVSWSMQQVQLAVLVDETIDAMRPAAEAKGVAVHARMAGDLAPVAGDPERLQRVLFNLIQNAIRHTPADGSVTVLAEPVAGWLEVEVADTGPGIAVEDRRRIFEPFQRGRAAGGDGAGLGLAISRAIVEAHGGRIWLEPGDAGTRVRFSLGLPPGSAPRPSGRSPIA
jgi:signal transduction histidine kinase